MSQYVKVLQHNGGFISLLADDDGVIQYTTNDADFDGIISGSTGDAVHADTADVATLADTATAPASAATFSTTLAAGNDVIVTLGAPGSTITVPSLNGNIDGDYSIEAVLLLTGNVAGNNVNLQPNAISANQVSNIQYFLGSGTNAAAIASLYLNGPTNTANSIMYVNGTLTSKTGRNRLLNTVALGFQTNGDMIRFFNVGVWSDTSTNITSLAFVSDQGLRAGSYVRIRKLRNLT